MIDLGKEDPKIAFVKLGSIGDCLHALPMVTELKRRFPKAFLAWVVEEKSKEVLLDQEGIDEVIVIDTQYWRRLFKKGRLLSLFRDIKRFQRELSNLHFDLAIDGQGLIKSGFITYFTGAPIRIGFSRSFCRESLNTLFTNYKIDPLGVHVIDQYLSLVREVRGLNKNQEAFKKDVSCSFIPSPQVLGRATDWLKGKGLCKEDPLVAIHPGASFESKKWPLESFIDLATCLMDRDHLQVVITPGETLKELEKLLLGRVKGPMILPPFTLRELAAFYKMCRIVVAGDTGPLHLASAVGSSTVGLFGPTEAKRNGPLGQKHKFIQERCLCRGDSPYSPRKCWNKNWCIGKIGVEEVYAKVKELLKN